MKYVKTVLACLSILIIIAFVIMVINHTAGAVELASRIDPLLGTGVMWSLFGLYAILVLIPLLLIMRLPAPLKPPEKDSGIAFNRHLSELRRRLSKNKRLKGMDLSGKDGVEKGLAELGKEVDTLAVTHAKYVFISTAISQNGKLDGLAVLLLQTRMIWQVAHIYNQRPSLREMMYLYGNVAGTVFLTAEIEDMDISEQIEPLIASVMGSVAGIVPGVQSIASIVAQSALTGAANAFLTLRVAMVTKQYCGALVQQPGKRLKRAASIQGASLLSTFARECITEIGGAIVHASGHAVKGAVRGAANRVGGAFSSAFPRRKKKDIPQEGESPA